MFLRWKSRKLIGKDAQGRERRSLYAVLVESQRIDGQPRQRIIKYLAHINENDLTNPVHQAYFWERSMQKLATLNLEPEDLKAVEGQLEKMVSRPRPNGNGKGRSGRNKSQVSAPKAGARVESGRKQRR